MGPPVVTVVFNWGDAYQNGKNGDLTEDKAVVAKLPVFLRAVMSMAEASTHARNTARRAFAEIDGVVPPAPAPRYSATPTHEPTAMTSCETLTAELIGYVGHSANEVAQMRSSPCTTKPSDRAKRRTIST